MGNYTDNTIVIVPDSFKGSLTSSQAAKAIERGVLKAAAVNTATVPMADGGEGTVEAMLASLGGTLRETAATGPDGAQVAAFYGVLADGSTAVIEMAAASGITLVSDERRDPLKLTSYGTGELIVKAVEEGCTQLYIGVGGSATNDGGMGMAQALGVRFYDGDGNELGVGADQLGRIARIDCSGMHPRLAGVKATVISDVTNPLCGEFGATAVFGPQKGVTAETHPVLESGLRRYAERIKEQLGRDVLDLPGAGAGGGIGAGLAAFLSAELQRGIEVVTAAAKLDELIRGAALVITGEGRTDRQTAFGKVPAGVAAIASAHGVPVICISGGLGDDYTELHKLGITACFSILRSPMPLDEAMRRAEPLLEEASEQAVRVFARAAGWPADA